MLTNSYGFSLIELMIVVTIVGLLAVIATPSYHMYIQRARFVEVMASTTLYKTAVTLALQQGAPLAEISNGVYGIPAAPTKTKSLADIKVEKGIITAIATELASNATYILTPNADGSSWSISGTCIKSGLCNG